MSNYEQKDNTGALFQANNMRVLKQGTALINGNDCNLIVTESKTKDGKTLYDTYVKVGGFFPNSYKTEGDSKPDITATININNEDMKLAGWKNVSKRGQPYISLSFKPSDDDHKANQTVEANNTPAETDMPDDNMPF